MDWDALNFKTYGPDYYGENFPGFDEGVYKILSDSTEDKNKVIDTRPPPLKFTHDESALNSDWKIAWSADSIRIICFFNSKAFFDFIWCLNVTSRIKQGRLVDKLRIPKLMVFDYIVYYVHIHQTY